jgi:hypothetical protein
MKSFNEIKSLSNLMITAHSDDGGSAKWFRLGKPFASVIWSFGGGWEHVSIAPFNRRYTPTWDDMCKLKDMFFYDNETVVQYHPAKEDYVNNIPNCLHLWRPLKETMPTPPAIMVGIKNGLSLKEIKQQINELG